MAGDRTRARGPQTLYLETTNRCNLRCRGCIRSRGGWEAERDFSLEEFLRITQQMPAMERAVLHGIGEPLLNPEIPAMIDHLKRRGVKVLFNSNGLLLNEEKQQQLIDAGLDELRISLDAASAEGYKALRNSSQFGQVTENLRTMIRRLKSQELSSPRVSIWFLGTQDNVGELPGVVRMAADLGVPEVYLQRLVYFLDHEGYGVAREEKSLYARDGKESDLFQRSEELARERGVRLFASGLSAPLDSVRRKNNGPSPWKECTRPWEVIYITAQGNVLPCCIAPFSTSNYDEIILGNVFEDSLEEIWLGTRYQSFRKKHQTTSPHPCCRGCGVHWSL